MVRLSWVTGIENRKGSPMSTEPVAGRGTVLQEPRLVLVCFRIWDGGRTAGTDVSRETPQEAVCSTNFHPK
jgi:hypothetical protein